MTHEILRNIYLDTRIESYRNFFSDDWGRRIDSLTAPARKLHELTFSLMMEWRATAYTASLPVAIIDHIKAYHDAFVNTGEINTTLLRLAEMTMPVLAQRVPQLTSDPLLVSRLRTEIVKIGADLETAKGKTPVEFSLQEAWNEYLGHHVYQLSLWGSQQHAYVSIYNSYDSYLASVVRVSRSLDKLRTSDRDFKSYLLTSFGSDLRDKCWLSRDMQIAREARHSLSHAGGAITDGLSKIKPTHGFKVVQDRIQITPDKTKSLFELLKDRVYAISEQAVRLPEFQ